MGKTTKTQTKATATVNSGKVEKAKEMLKKDKKKKSKAPASEEGEEEAEATTKRKLSKYQRSKANIIEAQRSPVYLGKYAVLKRLMKQAIITRIGDLKPRVSGAAVISASRALHVFLIHILGHALHSARKNRRTKTNTINLSDILTAAEHLVDKKNGLRPDEELWKLFNTPVAAAPVDDAAAASSSSSSDDA